MTPVEAVAAKVFVTARMGFTGPKAGLVELAMRNGLGAKQRTPSKNSLDLQRAYFALD